jgi:hypothetical protein
MTAEDVRDTGRRVWAGFQDARFWWGVLAATVSAAFFMVSVIIDWNRQDEREHGEMQRMNERLLQLDARFVRRDQEFNLVQERVSGLLNDVRGLLDRAARLEASRVEDDKNTQANALRDAEYRARVAAELARISSDLNRLAQTNNTGIRPQSSEPSQLEEFLRRGLWLRQQGGWQFNDNRQPENIPLMPYRLFLWADYQRRGFPVRTPVGE